MMDHIIKITGDVRNSFKFDFLSWALLTFKLARKRQLACLYAVRWQVKYCYRFPLYIRILLHISA